jgi:hypothetical protein
MRNLNSNVASEKPYNNPSKFFYLYVCIFQVDRAIFLPRRDSFEEANYFLLSDGFVYGV